MSTAHAANGITSTNITNWNSAYGWGNHASAGYWTSYTETDPSYSAKFDLTNVANGDLLKYNGTKFVKFTPNYLTAEVDGSVTNEVELPTQTGNSGKFLSTNGTLPTWTTALTAEADGSITNEIQTLSLNTNWWFCNFSKWWNFTMDHKW